MNDDFPVQGATRRKSGAQPDENALSRAPVCGRRSELVTGQPIPAADRGRVTSFP